MYPVQDDLREFRARLDEGSIQRAYGALLAYVATLRTHFERTAVPYRVSALYQGCLDMTYFALFPPALHRRGLKVAVVFDYGAFRFEAWLAGTNREVQRAFWQVLRDADLPGCRIVTPATGVDAIVERDLTGPVDLADPDALTRTIERATLEFVGDVERFLDGCRTGPPTHREP